MEEITVSDSAAADTASSLPRKRPADEKRDQQLPSKKPHMDNEPRPTEVKEREISRGAEAVVSVINFLGRKAIQKQRLPKRYRHPELDAKLTSRRLQQEARVLLRLRKEGIRVPAVYSVNVKSGLLIMECVPGLTLKELLQENQQGGDEVMRKAGRAVAKMHKCDIVHGDLTTGNILVHDGKVCIIDFGLSGGNGTEEDLAVDLYVLERAVVSAHSEKAQPLNEAFLVAYAEELRRPAVLKRLEEVRARGRKRDMSG
ncbi:TP53-regulating kinase [Gracilariopsis chorda]|uniref:non-specific serine/threonine protein kinase n=1 Tax=Gracilariopsis chorda TaxID=448386 RepID=A0A2V3ISL9_9FLOR|nr:TP53-regulating kinase [Gracilariopsis chorda]|eukprot:PXF44100.1 TP53-regulating kinase [Gracilariopsis chorda]